MAHFGVNDLLIPVSGPNHTAFLHHAPDGTFLDRHDLSQIDPDGNDGMVDVRFRDGRIYLSAVTHVRMLDYEGQDLGVYVPVQQAGTGGARLLGGMDFDDQGNLYVAQSYDDVDFIGHLDIVRFTAGQETGRWNTSLLPQHRPAYDVSQRFSSVAGACAYIFTRSAGGAYHYDLCSSSDVGVFWLRQLIPLPYATTAQLLRTPAGGGSFFIGAIANSGSGPHEGWMIQTDPAGVELAAWSLGAGDFRSGPIINPAYWDLTNDDQHLWDTSHAFSGGGHQRATYRRWDIASQTIEAQFTMTVDDTFRVFVVRGSARAHLMTYTTVVA